ncbi:MAG: ATP-dependent helicase HrpB [Verrucomicrobiaceae bacterium]|nr:ATP-dependent helicase HrpB [Verrucomicrobiaceae bacterium]
MDLPVFEIREELLESLRKSGRVLLSAPTGSGKSTGVPPMLLEEGLVEGMIVVVQPRRIAARLLAEFVARSLGVKLGAEVGYAVRFDGCYGRDTRIVYVTDGVLQRWLREDPGLSGIGSVIFDEFHERRLASDLALARVLELQDGARPELRILVMSATLETRELGSYLAPCEELQAGGRLYPVEVFHQAPPPPRRGRSGAIESVPVWEQVARACRQELGRLQEVDLEIEGAPRILVFLPGAFEIRRTAELLERSSWARGWEVKQLYSALSPKAQWDAVGPGQRPRIIVATNVAETSITIEGIVTVIDSGLARIAAFDSRRGIDTLTIQKISQAAAQQRAGRAGRTGPGRCVRLWSERDHARRDDFERPEVYRVDLAAAVLDLKAAGVKEVRSFRWLDPPPEDSLERAEHLLGLLGALDTAGEVTEVGLRMARYPLAPQAARLLEAAEMEGCVVEACFVAAVLQGEGVFTGKASRAQRGVFQQDADRSDFEADWRACEVAEGMRFDPVRCGEAGIHARKAQDTLKAWQQLCRLSGRVSIRPGQVLMEELREALGRAVLAAFGGHVAVRSSKGSLACRVTSGRRGKLDESSIAREARIFVATEITEVQGREMTVNLRHAVKVEEGWLREMFPAAFREEAEAVFDETARRVMARRKVLFYDLVLEEGEAGQVSDEDASALLAEQIVSGSFKLKRWDTKVERWIARIAFVATAMPELELSAIGAEEREMIIEQVCRGARSYREVKDRDVWPVLRDWLSALQHSALETYAPERIELVNGIRAKVTYEEGADPTIALKVQQLYGVEETPVISGTPVQLQVLGPSQRPWQVTQDLKSFWKTGYPQMKKELAGRYPRHEWR